MSSHYRLSHPWWERGLPLHPLEALAEALLDFIGPADLAAWLAEHAV